MLILAVCPHCRADHELTPKLLGETIYCLKCTQAFVVEETQKPDDAPIVVQSVFAVDADFHEPLATATSSMAQPKPRQADGKHSLIVPPPPVERWLPHKSEDEERFPEFQHDSRELRRFLEREEGSGDHSWLLAGGLFAATLMVLAFLVWLIYLLAFRRE